MPGKRGMWKMRTWLIAAAVGCLAAGCDGLTDPRTRESVQPGFEDSGQRRYGVPRLIVSTDIAIGRTVEPKVLSPVLDSAAARAAARFKSTRGDVIAVADDGRLTARALGQAEVIVNLDGGYDTVAVNVIDGFTYTVHPWPSGVSFRGFNLEGDFLGMRGWWETAEGTVIRDGGETRIPGCEPFAINAHGDVACQTPGGASRPVLFRDGVLTPPLLPSTSYGRATDINDAGQVLGDYWDRDLGYGWFVGSPDSLAIGTAPQWVSGGMINQAGVGIVSVSSVDSYYYPSDYLVSGGSATLLGAGVLYLNDVGDVLAAPANALRSMPAPYVTLVRWQGTTEFRGTETDYRCHAAQITNRRRMIGTGPEGWCLVERGGRYTIIEHATKTSGPAGWTIAWGTDARTQGFFYIARRYHASGVMALTAHNAAGDTAVVLLRTDAPQ